jgi:5'-deoxynucleotidase YfbR-like HD superfamily hydrolase
MEFHSTDGFPETAIRLVNGNVFDYADPMAAEFDYHDVAHALARTARFGGHTAMPFTYTVAAHVLLVTAIVTFVYHQPQAALGALHHDDVEFVTGDWPSPMKRYIKSRGFDYKRELERPIETAIARQLNLSVDDLHSGVIKDADRLAFVVEGIAMKPQFDPADQGFDDIEPEMLALASNYLLAVRHPGAVEGVLQEVHSQLMNGANPELVLRSLGLTALADLREEEQSGEGDDAEAQDA